MPKLGQGSDRPRPLLESLRANTCLRAMGKAGAPQDGVKDVNRPTLWKPCSRLLNWVLLSERVGRGQV